MEAFDQTAIGQPQLQCRLGGRHALANREAGSFRRGKQGVHARGRCQFIDVVQGIEKLTRHVRRRGLEELRQGIVVEPLVVTEQPVAFERLAKRSQQAEQVLWVDRFEDLWSAKAS